MVKGQLVTIYVDPLKILSPKDHEGMGVLIRQLPRPRVWNPNRPPEPEEIDDFAEAERGLENIKAVMRGEEPNREPIKIQPPEPETELLTSWPPEDAPIERWRFCWVDNPAYVKGIDPEELETVGEERYILRQ